MHAGLMSPQMHPLMNAKRSQVRLWQDYLHRYQSCQFKAILEKLKDQGQLMMKMLELPERSEGYGISALLVSTQVQGRTAEEVNHSAGQAWSWP